MSSGSYPGRIFSKNLLIWSSVASCSVGLHLNVILGFPFTSSRRCSFLSFVLEPLFPGFHDFCGLLFILVDYILKQLFKKGKAERKFLKPCMFGKCLSSPITALIVWLSIEFQIRNQNFLEFFSVIFQPPILP